MVRLLEVLSDSGINGRRHEQQGDEDMLSRKIAAGLLAGFSLLGGSASSTAGLVTVSGHSVGPSTYLTQGNSVSGGFDISAAVAALGISSPYVIASASATFNFQDNADVIQSGSVTTSQFIETTSCGSTCTHSYKYVDTKLSTSTNPYESALAQIGGVSQSAASNHYSFITVSPERPSLYTACNMFGCEEYQRTRPHSFCDPISGGCVTRGPYPVFERTHFTDSGYDGAFSATIQLDDIGIADLMGDGLINFSIAAASGDFLVRSAMLTFDIEASDPTSRVPEPASFALVALGLCGLTASTRAGRKIAQR